MPTWLSNLSPTDIANGPMQYLSVILNKTLAYPMISSDDISPIRQFKGSVYSYIFFHPFDDGSIEKFMNADPGYCHKHDKIIGSHKFQTNKCILPPHGFVKRYDSQITDGESCWLVYESETFNHRGTTRYSLLLVGMDPLVGFAGFYSNNNCYPEVYISHGHSSYMDANHASECYKTYNIKPPRWVMSRDAGIYTGNSIPRFGADYLRHPMSDRVDSGRFPDEDRILFELKN
jgi:hypothetical protein